MKSAILVFVCAAALSGCASVVRGTTEKVSINSDPPDAAIRTSLGHSCPQSPCTVEVSRKTDFMAFAEKDGYKPGQMYIGTHMGNNGTAGMAGNILVGGLVGVGVDAVSGATLDHYPNPAMITLAPVDSPLESTNIVKPPPVKTAVKETRLGR